MKDYSGIRYRIINGVHSPIIKQITSRDDDVIWGKVYRLTIQNIRQILPVRQLPMIQSTIEAIREINS